MKCSGADKCGRALTDKIRNDAQRFNMPVSVYMNAPVCFVEIESAVIVEEVSTNNQTEVNDVENQ
jgi:hypothetical protein